MSDELEKLADELEQKQNDQAEQEPEQEPKQEQEQAEVEPEEAEQDQAENGEADEAEDKAETESEQPAWWVEAQELANKAAGNAKKKERAKQERLQAKLKDEHDSEVERLKQEIESLKAAPQNGAVDEGLKRPVRPLESSFETDEEYNAALSKYDDDLYEYRRQSDLQRNQQEMAQAQQQKAQQKAIARRQERISSHYERAEKLITDMGMTEDAYRTADMMFRQSLGDDNVADALIERLGEGSEKVVLSVGINGEKRDKLTELLKDDPSGIEAALYLGQQKAIVSNSGKVSKARKPAPQVKGNGGTTGQLEKKYKEAMKAGKVQDAYNIKKAARKEKINTSNW